MNEHLQERLDAAFPASADAHLIRGVREGILLADGVMENEPILRTLVGGDLRGYVRRAGILFRVHDMCATGDIPLNSEMMPMPRGNWHWVELRSGGFKAHICRTDGPGAFPEDTPTRQDQRLANQPDLFTPKVVPLRILAAEIKEMYAWLTFGVSAKGKLEHLCWAMPAVDSDGWLAHTNVLARSALTETPVPPESPTKNLGLRFKEHIEEALSKSEDEGESEPEH